MNGITISYKVDFWSRGVVDQSARRLAKKGPARQKKSGEPTYCARMLALAYCLDRGLADGSIRTFAHAAEVLGVSHTRASQILGLINLKPEIQEAVLRGEVLVEKELRRVAREAKWEKQGYDRELRTI